MIHKNCEGQVPQPGSFTADDDALFAIFASLTDDVRGHMNALAFNLALDAIWAAVRACNAYVDAQAPWVLKKEDPDRMGTVLYVLAEAIRVLAILMQAFTPIGCGKILDQIGAAEGARDFSCLSDSHAVAPGTPIDKPKPAFPRIELPEEEGTDAG